ncbi:hypothetical protein ACP179_01090 (plasmid) [Xenorhabdus stockiae]|uniref:hypothetical protein n=1 Tax=Xenorhabdus stockiae TaxID=351614 RepID=UPI003CFB95B9
MGEKLTSTHNGTSLFLGVTNIVELISVIRSASLTRSPAVFGVTKTAGVSRKQAKNDKIGLYYNQFPHYIRDIAQYLTLDSCPDSENVTEDNFSVKQTGARQVLNPDSVIGWEKAEKFYDKIRADHTDISTIVKNTGWKEFIIARIKDHVFFREHELGYGKGKGLFDADPEMVNAWERLKKGDFVKSDIELLRHEYFESRFERIFSTDYITSHNAAVRSGRDWKP